jgi:hypothetical protein
MSRTLPRYPVYIPSKGRADNPLTAQFLIKDGVPFYFVVEPSDVDAYAKVVRRDRVLILPWSTKEEKVAFCRARGIETGGGVIAARNWIKEHATSAGYKRHWQLDDNISGMFRRIEGLKLPCRSGVAFAAMEDFVDRYENIGIAGANYFMFAANRTKIPPYYLNAHVYSCTLVLNEDTDICLQVLAGGLCTVAFNAFLAYKMQTMTMKGGNTDALYGGDGRLRMARTLERRWPGIVTTRRRFGRPQHVVFDSWKRFDTPLKRRADLDWSAIEAADANEYGMHLTQVKSTLRSVAIRGLLDRYGKKP